MFYKNVIKLGFTARPSSLAVVAISVELRTVEREDDADGRTLKTRRTVSARNIKEEKASAKRNAEQKIV